MANILKSESTPEGTDAARRVSGLAGFNLSDLADEGRSRLEECRNLVRQMIGEAQKEAVQIRAQAKAEGHQEGLREAAAEVDQRVQEASEAKAKNDLRLIRHAVEQLHATHQSWMESYADSLTSIALAAAERIVRQKLERESDIIVGWAEDAIRSTRSATSLTLAVHPETLAQLGQAFDELLAAPGLPEKTHVEPDESVRPGDVVVRQPGGEIHAGMQSQLDRLSEMLS